MSLWKNWYFWVTGTSGAPIHTVPAFHWIRGRVGQRQNPDGMRSLIHYGVSFALLSLIADWLLVYPAGPYPFIIMAAVHSLWISALLMLLVFNVGFLETLDGRPLGRLNGANILTLGRLLLLPLLAYLIGVRQFSLAAPLYLILAATDVLDGLWARWKKQITKLGIVLDPLADVAFHLWVFGALSWAGLIPPWILVLVLIRYALLIGGGIFLYLTKGQIRVLPTPFGKATGVLITAATMVLLVSPASSNGWLDWIVRGLGVILLLTVLHVIAIGWVNLRLPLQTDPAPTQVRGRWAQSLKKQGEDREVDASHPGESGSKKK
ncbi:MAG: CDP-alcohol phosphatidyltransferase family protein [Candidatus Eisenbacteria bacterium]|uniref:CDP-alcohol phosphatidyltransferase family protein n=1 Tax=Eiseniibacteriota bacterium TaxID=2212470 RepID=A0A948RTK2_UNCEI|nr:CDP-alcohol phosphatidyltransferase family protein [Candidatus Eisenbacteria bacterium]MBU2689474.1 CDP-alcohol phosphatidyltransferase family protein [Candidatus Eisenbacteria bacterium]